MEKYAKMRRYLATTIFTVFMVVCCVQYVSADTTCVITGNVEVNISPESITSNTVSFTFSNHNSYKVTVNATFSLKDVDGKTKTISKVFVIAPDSDREISFDAINLELSRLKPNDCGAEMIVQKCE